MPGCGKSTIGVLLAKAMGFRFIDTDITIQNRTGMLLQQIIDQNGLDWFCIEEERAIMSVEESGGCVIATGGSAVYSRSAMMYLKEHGYVYYLALPVEQVEKRLQIDDGSWLSDAPYGTIHQVASDGTIHGFFSQIVDYCWAQIPHLRVDTHADNQIMQHLIRKNGFEQRGIIYVLNHSPRIEIGRASCRERV